MECYDPKLNHYSRYGIALPSFSELLEHGTVCAAQLPGSHESGLARTVGTLMKQDFPRAALNGIHGGRCSLTGIGGDDHDARV